MATKSTKTTKASRSTKPATTTRKTTTTRTPARKTTTARSAAMASIEAPDGEYRPISMWGYFGWGIVYAIPVIGWIICVGQAFCANNRNLRNFARSQFCWLILWLIWICVLAGLGVFTNLFTAFGWI